MAVAQGKQDTGQQTKLCREKKDRLQRQLLW
jgi:hypothetical protein